MNSQDEASSIKFKNVIDMSIAFTSMIRVFEKRSKQKIAKKLESTLSLLPEVDGKDTFENIHAEFCEWFVEKIKSAEKVLNNNTIKKAIQPPMGRLEKSSMSS